MGTLTFLGAAGTVTGSKYLIHSGDERTLVDCGLFQGLKPLRLRNWAPFPIEPASIQSVVLTHAHLDHSGYLPLLAQRGFSGPVVCTQSTRDLCGIVLPDSGHIHERDAEFANRHGFSKHHPALPLYTEQHAREALELFKSIPFGREHPVGTGAAVTLRRAGHILGASIVELRVAGTRLAFSGDLGRPQSPTMHPPERIAQADLLVVESTYGNRKHDASDAEELLADVVRRTAARGGTLLVPAFAVGRTQTLLYHLNRLKRAGLIPPLPVYVDSPMAINATEIFYRNGADHRLSEAECDATCAVAEYVRAVEGSKELDRSPLPKILISASGMATGGRILHHLKRLAPDPRNTILFTGFQAAGTRGEAMLRGAGPIKIHGGYVDVRAEVRSLDGLSAHADADEIMAWLRGFSSAPGMTFITHGEPEASEALRTRIEKELGWSCRIPELGDTVPI